MLLTNFSRQSLAIAGCLAALSMAASTSVAQVDFDGEAGADTSWNTGLNWVGDAVPNDAQTARLDSGDVVTVDGNTEVGDVDSTDASIDLSSGIIEVGGILDLDSTTVTRNGGSFEAGSLVVSGSTVMTYEGSDSTSRVQAMSGGQLSILKDINVFEGSVTDGGLISINAIFNTTPSFPEFFVEDSTLSVGTGGVYRGNITLTDSTFSRTGDGGQVDSNSFTVLGNSNVTFVAGDEIDTLDLVSTATSQVVQNAGESEGLIFTGSDIENELVGNGNLELVFDSAALLGVLDYGLRVDGDQVAEVQSLIDNGRIISSGGAGPVEVIRDTAEYGDFTYVGIVAVPEPSTGIVLVALGLCGLTRRSRR